MGDQAVNTTEYGMEKSEHGKRQGRTLRRLRCLVLCLMFVCAAGYMTYRVQADDLPNTQGAAVKAVTDRPDPGPEGKAVTAGAKTNDVTAGAETEKEQELSADGLSAADAEENHSNLPVSVPSAETKGIHLNYRLLVVRSGGRGTLRVTGAKKRKVTWSVRNRKTAFVKKKGMSAVVRGKRAGTTVVTAKVGKKKLKCTVIVLDPSVMDLDRVVQWTQKWRKGTWKEDGYHNQDGELLADMSLALSCETDTVPNASSCPILYIGASRTKNTADAVKDKKVYFYYCGGAGFRWFFNPTFHYGRRIEPAFQVIRTYLARRPSGTVIIDLGGNDLSNIEAYVGFYRKLLSLYPEGKIWFMGVLPRKKGNATNSRRREFNMRLDRELPGHVINLYDWVYKQRDFKTKDGIHYYPRFSRKIYKKTMEKIGCRVTVNMKTGRVKHK